MQHSSPLRWLAAAIVALLALAFPLRGAGADGLGRHGSAFAVGSGLTTALPRSRAFGRSRAHRVEREIRHRLRQKALRRGHGAREVMILAPGMVSGGRTRTAIVIERHPFRGLEKGGIFGSPTPREFVFVQPRRLHRAGAAKALRPRTVIVHRGHGLYDHRSTLFGGTLGEHLRAVGRRDSVGAHPRVLVVEPRE